MVRVQIFKILENVLIFRWANAQKIRLLTFKIEMYWTPCLNIKIQSEENAGMGKCKWPPASDSCSVQPFTWVEVKHGKVELRLRSGGMYIPAEVQAKVKKRFGNQG